MEEEKTSKVDFKVLDEAVKKVLAFKPKKNREGKVNGSKARAESMTPEEQSELARIAAKARWG